MMFNKEYFEEVNKSMKEESKNEKCYSCKFIKAEGNYFICRRNPPQVSPSDTGSTGRLKFGVFPSVDKDNWCGEYRNKFR